MKVGAETRTASSDDPIGDAVTTHGQPLTSAFTPALTSHKSRSVPLIDVDAMNDAPSSPTEMTATAIIGHGLGAASIAVPTGRGSEVEDGGPRGYRATRLVAARPHSSTILARYVRMV